MGYFAMTTAISSAVAPAASVALLQGTGAEGMIYVAADMFGYTIMYFTVAIFPIAASVISAVVIKSEAKEREGQS